MSLQASLGPLQWIDGPYPVIRPYRLLDVATIVPDLDPHWRSGAQVYSYPPDLAHTWNPCPDGSSQQPSTKLVGGIIPIPIFNAFTVYLAETCQSKGIGAIPNIEEAQARFEARAEAVFAAVEAQAVELEFSQGFAVPSNPFLADGEGVPLNSGAATDPIEALALLEDAIADTGRGGVIHATPATVTAWESTGFTLDRVGTILTTRACGTPIVVGTGYLDANPFNVADPGPRQAWAFATGPVQIRRSPNLTILPERVDQAINTATNEITYRVERDYLVDWDTVLQAEVLVDRSICPCGA